MRLWFRLPHLPLNQNDISSIKIRSPSLCLTPSFTWGMSRSLTPPPLVAPAISQAHFSTELQQYMWETSPLRVGLGGQCYSLPLRKIVNSRDAMCWSKEFVGKSLCEHIFCLLRDLTLFLLMPAHFFRWELNKSLIKLWKFEEMSQNETFCLILRTLWGHFLWPLQLLAM